MYLTLAKAVGGQSSARELVVKGRDRIDALPEKGLREHHSVQMFTPTLCRIMRRDFNLTCVRLYWAGQSRTRQAYVREILQTLREEADALENMTRVYSFPEVHPLATCSMLIVCDEAQTFFDTLVVADRALAKLLESPLGELAEETIAPFLRAYGQLRRQLFQFPGRQQR